MNYLTNVKLFLEHSKILTCLLSDIQHTLSIVCTFNIVSFFLFLALMTDWNKKALECMRENLKISVKMIQLADMLERSAGGFMNRAEAVHVRAIIGDAQMMGQVIEVLLGKENEAFYTFCSMLRRSNYESLASTLESTAERFKTVEGSLADKWKVSSQDKATTLGERQ